MLTQLTACRAIAGEAERLACFDRQVAALEQAEASREIAVVDRQQIRRTRRSLFGLTLPDLGIFGGDDDDGRRRRRRQRDQHDDPFDRARARTGGWSIALEDDSVWVQTEGRVGRHPRSGETIRIRRGPLGSFIATVERTGRESRVIRQR